MKFRVGDKVKVRKDLEVYERYGNMTYVDDMEKMRGKIVTIKEVNGKSYRIKEFNYNWTDEMFEDKTIFTKSDLKDGDIVTYRNGEKATFTKNEFHIIGDGREIENNYDEKLNAKYGKKYDIIKVERLATVFERKEEILDETEKRYLRDVIRPFRKNVKEIIKWKYSGREEYFIKIRFQNNKTLNLPDFTDKTMYKNMEAYRTYTLEELKL